MDEIKVKKTKVMYVTVDKRLSDLNILIDRIHERFTDKSDIDYHTERALKLTREKKQ